jgi:allophanate hydrolase subunit 1
MSTTTIDRAAIEAAAEASAELAERVLAAAAAIGAQELVDDLTAGRRSVLVSCDMRAGRNGGYHLAVVVTPATEGEAPLLVYDLRQQFSTAPGNAH